MASQPLQSEHLPPKGEKFGVETGERASKQIETPLNSDSSEKVFKSSSEEYAQLQQRIFLVILVVSALAVPITAYFFGIVAASSLLLGSIFGALYLRLLARSVGKIGQGGRQVSKVQLLVPVVLVLLASRLQQVELIPSLLGFLLYKPSLIIQFLFENWISAETPN